MNPNPIGSLISSCLFCSLFYFPVPRASFPYSPFPVLVNLFHSRDLCKFGTRHLHNKKFNSHRNWWGHVHGGLFVVKFRRRHVHFRYKKQLLRKCTTAGPKRVKTDGFLYRTLYVWFGDLFKTYFLQAADHLNVLKLVSFINIVD